jgi:hypothetical protein
VTSVQWRKSSRSTGSETSTCVEVAKLSYGIGIRDSKDPAGPVLTVSRAGFSAFAEAIKARAAHQG